MRIGVLGKGRIGGTLGKKWQSAGHDVVFGTRIPDASVPSQVSVPQAIGSSSVVLFAVPASAVPQIIQANLAGLAAKVLIDATNNMAGPAMSSVDLLSTEVPSSKVFRAFNSLGWENFAAPAFGHDRADLFYCGPPDKEATGVVEELIEAIGLRPVRIGELDKVDLLDSVTKLWFTLAIERGMGRHTAFKVLSD